MNPTVERQLHLTIGSRFENIELVQMTVDEALREAVANAIKHGNRQDASKQVEIEVGLSGGELEIRVADEGPGFDPDGVKDPLAPENKFRADGRGIFYMRKFMDDVRYAFRPSGGTIVILRKRLATDAGRTQEK